VHTSKLTREQVEKLQAAVRPMLGYIGRLAERMQKLGWDASDPATRPRGPRTTSCTPSTSTSITRAVRRVRRGSRRSRRRG